MIEETHRIRFHPPIKVVVGGYTSGHGFGDPTDVFGDVQSSVSVATAERFGVDLARRAGCFLTLGDEQYAVYGAKAEVWRKSDNPETVTPRVYIVDTAPQIFDAGDDNDHAQVTMVMPEHPEALSGD